MRALLATTTLIAMVCGPLAASAVLGAQRDDSKTPDLRGFAITLAMGDVENGKSAGAFTPAATKALADLKDFLPYKSYRLLDTVWVLGLNGPHQYLHDADGWLHEFYMDSSWEIIAPPNNVGKAENGIKIRMLRLWGAVTHKGGVSELLIDTSLEMKIGETVVVGTSRLDSSHGLLLLVTAMPK